MSRTEKIDEIQDLLDNLHVDKCIAKVVYGDYTSTDWDVLPDIRYLLDELKKREWVPVGERLPEDGDWCWVWDGEKVTLAVFEGFDETLKQWTWREQIDTICNDELGYVLSWQPDNMPEPPEATV